MKKTIINTHTDIEVQIFGKSNFTNKCNICDKLLPENKLYWIDLYHDINSSNIHFEHICYSCAESLFTNILKDLKLEHNKSDIQDKL